MIRESTQKFNGERAVHGPNNTHPLDPEYDPIHRIIDEKASPPPIDEPKAKPKPNARLKAKPDADDAEPTQPTADILMNLASECVMFRDAEAKGAVSFRVGDHTENDYIDSSRFRSWLRYQYYSKFTRSCNGDATRQAIDTLAAKAIHEGIESEFPIRVAEDGGSIFIDICDDAWRAIRIDRRDWRIDPSPAVRFRRRPGMCPLPEPERGGSVDDLRKYLNIGSDDDWLLMTAWLTSAMRPQGPYAVMILEGEQGSAKSTTARFLRSLIDPHKCALRSEPRDERDLMISANNTWLLAYDNISRLPPWLSDGFCRIATGGGFATRELFKNDDEVFFDAKRPILLNGIVDVATRPDLLDRSIIMRLPVIPDDRRREEADIVTAFERDRPRIFGAMLGLIASAIDKLGSLTLDRHTRMADFDYWGSAIGLALGLKEDAFLDAFVANRAEANITALEASPVASAIQTFMMDRIEWNGKASTLLDELNALHGEYAARQRAWPKASHTLSAALKRLAPPLRLVGIDIDFSREKDSRSVHLTRRL